MIDLTLDDLKTQITSAAWFTRLGQFPGGPGTVALPNLNAWAADALDNPLNPSQISENMIWLPSSRDQTDPIHGNTLRGEALRLAREQDLRQGTLEVYTVTLSSLRRMHREYPLLQVGPVNYAPVAEGAALFAAWQAAAAIIVGMQSFYCSLIPLYAAGYWPCGITRRKDLVVLLYASSCRPLP